MPPHLRLSAPAFSLPKFPRKLGSDDSAGQACCYAAADVVKRACSKLWAAAVSEHAPPLLLEQSASDEENKLIRDASRLDLTCKEGCPAAKKSNYKAKCLPRESSVVQQWLQKYLAQQLTVVLPDGDLLTGALLGIET